MPPALSIASHIQYLEIWNRVLTSPEGISITLASETDAIQLRARLYYARKATCRENKKIYPRDHVMHGKSPFDTYSIKLEEQEGLWELRIIQGGGIDILEIKELT